MIGQLQLHHYAVVAMVFFQPCVSLLISNVSLATCVEIGQIAEMSCLDDVARHVLRFQCDNIEALGDSDYFHQMSFERVCELLGSSELNLFCELQVRRSLQTCQSQSRAVTVTPCCVRLSKHMSLTESPSHFVCGR